MTMQPDEEQLKEIQVMAQRIHPGRSWEQLSPEEQRAVYRSYRNTKDLGQDIHAQGSRMMRDSTRQVGPLNVTVQNPWESLAGGLMAGAGIGMQARANKDQATGREALADLQTRRDAVDREVEDRRIREEEARRRAWLQTILSRGQIR